MERRISGLVGTDGLWLPLVTMEEAIAFGDGTNDLTMLRAAGLGVAMGNAAPEVKAAADMVTDDNEHSGVAKVIRKIL